MIKYVFVIISSLILSSGTVFSSEPLLLGTWNIEHLGGSGRGFGGGFGGGSLPKRTDEQLRKIGSFGHNGNLDQCALHARKNI